jgi:hypothetical protein
MSVPAHALFADDFIRVMHVDGVRWTVRAIWASTFDRRGGTHLMFESDTTVHRVRSFPENWDTLDDDALGRLGSCGDAAENR